MSKNGVTHNLKIESIYFEEVLKGNKNFEIRKNDRDFHKGDTLVLRELKNSDEEYTGRQIVADVTFITTYGQAPGFVVMGIKVTNLDAGETDGT